VLTSLEASEARLHFTRLHHIVDSLGTHRPAQTQERQRPCPRKDTLRLTAREITAELHSGCKWQAGALDLLQKIAEDHLVRTLEC
jgi:hypothetical protein